jgi:outer membrane protein OmpA-like peptidoglycan-associated protein
LSAIDTSGVAFLPGSVAFTAASEAPLTQLQEVLEQYPQGRVRIEGHTDNTGPDSVNLRVSTERAAAVANYLTGRGISAEQVIVKGYGSTQPVDDNNTEVGRARNRRIEVSPVN